MRYAYGPKTHVLCRGCRRKIFIPEAEVDLDPSGLLVTVECKHETCPLYAQPIQFVAELEIHG